MPQMRDYINGGAGICLWILVLDLYKIYKYSIASYDK